jgi:hypothetical protein
MPNYMKKLVEKEKKNDEEKKSVVVISFFFLKKNQMSNFGASAGAAAASASAGNPFRMPSDEELFFLREEERRNRLQEREQMRNRKIYEKTTSTSGATHIAGGFREDAKPTINKSRAGTGLNSQFDNSGNQNNNGDWTQGGNNNPNASSSGGGGTVKNSMSAYIKRKRKMGLARMSLATKRLEIRKLDEEAARAEKRIKQQEEQLHETRAKFSAFLQTTDQDQVEARQRAEAETKAKQEKVQEMKKLSTQIAQIEAEQKKYHDQLMLCLEYKRFLDTLTDQEWFYDTLTKLRIEDATNQIRAAADSQRHQLAVQAAQAGQHHNNSNMNNILIDQQHHNNNSEHEDELIAQRIAEIEERMDVEMKRASDEITAEVKGMKLEAVKKELDDMDADRVPMFFTSPDQILMKFLDIEENNLFLIRHCQSIEEQKDDIEQKYRIESAEIASIAQQRREQMHAVSQKIAEEESKLKAVQERISNARSAGMTTGGISEDEMKKEIEKKVRAIYSASCTQGRDANIETRTLGMLTQIEVKIDETRQEIKNLKIDHAFIAQVLSNRDKERRKAARELALQKQQEERDRRSRAALERSQAPVKKRVGKPVMKRTAPADFGKKKADTSEVAAVDDDAEFFS